MSHGFFHLFARPLVIASFIATSIVGIACSGAPATAVCEADDECEEGLACIEGQDTIGGGGACSSAPSGLKQCTVSCTSDDDCDDVHLSANIDRALFVCFLPCDESPGYCSTTAD